MTSESPRSQGEKVADLNELPQDSGDHRRDRDYPEDGEEAANGNGSGERTRRSPSRSPTPVKRRERSPSRARSPTPVKRRERSRSKSRSPVRRRSYSPRRRSISPRRERRREQRRSRSPPRRHTTSRRDASPPRRRSPRRGRSPLRNRYNGIGKPGNNLFIAGFNFITNEKDLERKFGKYGRVLDARIVRDARGS